MTSEFSRPVALDQIGREPRSVTVEATPKECEALARRMGLPAIVQLSCTFDLRRASGAVASVAAQGRLRASVVQVCVVTLDEFPGDVEEVFDLRFVPAGSESEEIDLDGPDELPYEHGRLDLGEAAAEQLALALDPFPRKPGVELAEPAPEPGTPLADLAKLRRH